MDDFEIAAEYAEFKRQSTEIQKKQMSYNSSASLRYESKKDAQEEKEIQNYIHKEKRSDTDSILR